LYWKKGEMAMKRLNRRTGLLLAIAVLVAAVIVVGVFVLEPGATGLFGATAVHLDPQNPIMYVDNYLGMRVSSTAKCNWFTSNNKVIYFNGDFQDTNAVQLWSTGPGSATIEARCGLFNAVHHSTGVTVRPVPVITPATPSIAVGQTVTLSVDAASTNCTWRTLGSGAITVPTTTGSSVVVTGSAHGVGAVEVGCINGTVQTSIYVQ
jgi:hypothetical protein